MTISAKRPTYRNTEVQLYMVTCLYRLLRGCGYSAVQLLLYSLAHIGIVAPSLGQNFAEMQLVFIEDTVNCGQADLVNACEMDIVLQDPVSDFPQGDGIICQNHVDDGGLLLACAFPASATSCWLSFYSHFIRKCKIIQNYTIGYISVSTVDIHRNHKVVL